MSEVNHDTESSNTAQEASNEAANSSAEHSNQTAEQTSSPEATQHPQTEENAAETSQESTSSKAGLQVPPSPVPKDRSEANPQTASKPPAPSVSQKTVAQKNSGQKAPQSAGTKLSPDNSENQPSRSLPVPLQALKAKKKPDWLRVIRQPWFRRLQEQNIFKNISRPPKIHPNSLLSAILAGMVIALQGYLNLPLPNLTMDGVNNLLELLGVPSSQWVESLPITYNFQLPLALLAGGALGSVLGAFSVLSFIIAGLFLAPIFANGGGLSYLSQPGFPFLVAMFIGSIISGYCMRRAFSPKKSLRQAVFLYLGGVFSVLTTHALALIGMTILLAITSPFLAPAHPIASWWQWVTHLSLEPLPYDLLSTCLFLWFVRYIRLSIYPALY